MLRTLFSAAIAAIVLPIQLSAQDLVPEERTVVNALGQTIVVSSAPMVRSGPLRDKPELQESTGPLMPRRPSRNVDLMHPYIHPDGTVNEVDPALQKSGPTRMRREPLVEWTAQTGNGIPPDPTGAAGPNHYVQCVNSSCRVYSKAGVAQGGAFSLNSLFPGSSGLGDPIVLYDRHADRWFISQMQQNPSGVLIAISETNDPGGDYFTYDFALNQFPDYPKYSIWWDGYYMTCNSSNTAIVFERDKMLLGQTAQKKELSAPGAINGGFRSVLPADADGDLPPAGTPCYFFNLEDDAWGTNPDRIKIYEMHTDWVNINNTTVTTSMSLPTDPFDTNFGFGFSNISQPGTSQKLDAVSQILYFRAPHLRFVDHSSVVLCHVVDVGGNKAAVRWYELRDANDGNWYIYQQGTWAPDAGHRWMASIAMDNQGNIGLGYSHTNPATSKYPGLRFTGRYSTDPLGYMTLPEEVIIEGGGSQTGFDRFGDYSHMSLDPNGTTFWHTGEYLNASGDQRTHVSSFDLVQTVGLDEPTGNAHHEARLAVTLQGDQVLVSALGLPDGDAMTLDLIAMDGRTVRSQVVRPAVSRWNGAFDVSGLPPSAYFVRLGRSDFQRVERIVLTR